MSGTSLDGVDAVLVEFTDLEQPRLIAKHYLPFDDGLRAGLLSLQYPQHNELHLVQLYANQLSHCYAQAVHELLVLATVDASQVVAMGCHGQTIRHRPELGYTLQIGNAALLAELTGITVVNDFRSRDIAAGGQGAPLVPAFHDKVLRAEHTHRVILNIGGISNVTNLPLHGDVLGFDCGPGNLLMDAWCFQHLGQHYDENGAWAASGVVDVHLLQRMLAEPFFAQLPPKSTGRDLFNLDWLTKFLVGHELAVDVQATLLELTCVSIAQSISQHCSGVQALYLCGGGARNGALRQRLQTLLPSCELEVTDVLGVSGDYLEAIAFAWLASQTLARQPANLPAVTGAKHPCVLGAVYFAS